LNSFVAVGASVLEVVKAFEEASGKPIPYEIVDRRLGKRTTLNILFFI
jgi:UDP-glucose 4-epimerase